MGKAQGNMDQDEEQADPEEQMNPQMEIDAAAEAAMDDAAADPFSLGDEGLFKSLVCKRAPSGEAFVGYKLRGQPLVLSSQVDGLPLVSLHLMVQDPHRGLMVASGVEGEPFLGVVNVDDVDVAFAMTNLTNDVLMFDIGGDARAIEEEHWEKKDTSFYSGRHRNNKRVNQSNILYPFRTNICDRNFQSQSAESNHVQTLHLKAAVADGAQNDAVAEQLAAALELHVYPKKSTPNEHRFASTKWGTHDSLIVVANPALLNEATECNLVRGDALKEASEHLGVQPEMLLQLLGIEKEAFEAVPSDIQHEALNMLLNTSPVLQLLSQQIGQQEGGDEQEPEGNDAPAIAASHGVANFGA